MLSATMSRKQEKEFCVEALAWSHLSVLAVVPPVVPCTLVGKASTPKEKPFSQIANIISKREKKCKKYIFLNFLLKKQKGKKERKYANKHCIKFSWYTSLLLLLIKNSVIYSY